MFVEEVVAFVEEKSKGAFIVNPDNFPESEFNYIYVPEKRVVFHLVELREILPASADFLRITTFFLKKDLKIIHLWEDVWLSKNKIVRSRILSLLQQTHTIPARLTQVRRIDKPVLDKFLNENHLQGTTTAKFKYGLFLPKKYERVLPFQFMGDELLVAVASFSAARRVKREEKEFRSFEMIRFANLLSFTVVGGMKKLLSAFVRQHSPDDIMTYADRDWSDGKNYQSLAFEAIGITPPQFFSIESEVGFDNKTTLNRRYATEILPNERQVFNTGNIKFLLKLKD